MWSQFYLRHRMRRFLSLDCIHAQIIAFIANSQNHIMNSWVAWVSRVVGHRVDSGLLTSPSWSWSSISIFYLVLQRSWYHILQSRSMIMRLTYREFNKHRLKPVNPQKKLIALFLLSRQCFVSEVWPLWLLSVGSYKALILNLQVERVIIW